LSRAISGAQVWALRINRLRYEVFLGRRYAHVSPTAWYLHPEDVRRVAADTRYVEIPPMFNGCLSFRYAPQLFPGLYDHYGVEPPEGRKRWLTNQLSSGDDVWISVQHAKFSRDHIAAIAAELGKGVALELADRTDRLLLLSNRPAEPRLPVKTGLWLSYSAWRMPMLLLLPIIAWLGWFFVAAVGYFPIAAAVLLVLGMLGLVRAFPRSTRVAWLAREFRGKARGEGVLVRLWRLG
jgi:hypothetical protein